jgi:hypothetical protein
MNRKGSALIVVLLLVVVVAIVVIGTWYYLGKKNTSEQSSLPASSAAVPSPETSDTYTNTIFDYSIVIPFGYRLASHWMQFENPILYPSSTYSLATAMWVELTASTESYENAFVSPLAQQYSSLDKNSTAYQSFTNSVHLPSDDAIWKGIDIVPVGINLQSEEQLNAQLSQQGKMQPFQNITLADGTNAILGSDLGNDVGTAFIPFKGNVLLPSGEPVTVLEIIMNKDNGFDQTAFNAVVNSFRYQ